MDSTQVIIDLDGTLTMYPGSSSRSLYSKIFDFTHQLDISKIASDVLAARESANLMINRYSISQIAQLTTNILELYNLHGKLIIFSRNFKLAAWEYLRELDLDKYFDFDRSYFWEQNKSDKDKIWPDVINEYPKMLYIDDDLVLIEKLRKLTPIEKPVKFVHVNIWLGGELLKL